MLLNSNSPEIKNLGLTEYQTTWQAMKDFVNTRDSSTRDELWITEHSPVYTQGLNGKEHHLLTTGNIPIIQTDRGGQVTYHGPGQLVVYCLLDLQRLELGIRQLVTCIELSIIALLRLYSIEAHAKKEAPGVYVKNAKIAALGLRIRKGNCYHGLSLNLDMDLSPFSGINPCGFQGLEVTQLSDHTSQFSKEQIQQQLCSQLIKSIGYDQES